MSGYKVIQNKHMVLAGPIPTSGFFERYCYQLRDMQKTGLDFITIWYQFCKVYNMFPKKPWHISGEELKNLNTLSDHEIFIFIAKAIGNFWKAGYTGNGF